MASVPAPTPVKRVATVDPYALPKAKTLPPLDPRSYIMMFYGPPGVGKSTFANGLGDNVLFLSTDRGTRFMSANRIDCLKWEAFVKVLENLQKPGRPPYDFICIDHVDDFANMAEEQVLTELNIATLGDAGFGKGWNQYRKMIERMVRGYMRLNIGVIFIAHEQTKPIKVRGTETNRTTPSMSKAAWGAIGPLADIIGYCGFRTMLVKVPGTAKTERKEVRVLETQPREEVYAKDRTKRSKSDKGWMPLNSEKFKQTFISPAAE